MRPYFLDNVQYDALQKDRVAVHNGLPPLELLEAEGRVKFIKGNGESLTSGVGKPSASRRLTEQKEISLPPLVFLRLVTRAILGELDVLKQLLGFTGFFTRVFPIVFRPGGFFRNLVLLPKTLAKGEVMQVDMDLLSDAGEGDVTVELLKGSDRSVVVTDTKTPDSSNKASTTLTVPAGTTETKMIYTETQVVVKKETSGQEDDIIHLFEAEITITP